MGDYVIERNYRGGFCGDYDVDDAIFRLESFGGGGNGRHVNSSHGLFESDRKYSWDEEEDIDLNVMPMYRLLVILMTISSLALRAIGADTCRGGDQPRTPVSEGPVKFGLLPIQRNGLGYKQISNTQVSNVSETQIHREVGTHKRKVNGALTVVNPTATRKHTWKGQGKCTTGKQRKKKGKLVGGINGGASSLNLRRGAIFRSAVAAISLSIAGESSRGRLLLSEAEASLEIWKALGLDYEGKEEEVISHLQDLETQDLERARTRDGDVN
ncbi:hypothetical protein TEA_005595 [Camellia sinensis var. sinensis]|uniref:Uncharacterized protein n=1 Tax=Camellia sinensis var. sinensis TaxID=542762 RepID=A0A4S4EHT7_CAMSN|nr:hypothetical protein TEA_005595 [Camellia sinensis var. sinensis]